MARSDTITLLPLDRYAFLMNISLPHFNQTQGLKAPVVKTCNGIWDQTARDNLAWAMSQAEEMISEFLGFYPAPKFTVAEEIAFGLPGVRRDWWNGEVRQGRCVLWNAD